MNKPLIAALLTTTHIALSVLSLVVYDQIYSAGKGFFEHWYDYVFAYYGLIGFYYPIVIFLGIFLAILLTCLFYDIYRGKLH